MAFSFLLYFCLALRCVAPRNLRSLRSLRPLYVSATGVVDAAFAFAVRFHHSMRHTSTLSTLLLLLPLLLRPPLTLARTYLPLVLSTLLCCRLGMSILFYVLIFPRPPLHTAPLEFFQGCSAKGGVSGRREPDTEPSGVVGGCGKPSGL